MKITREKKVTREKREIIIKALEDGSIKRFGERCYGVPESFFVQGITPIMVRKVDEEK